MTWSPTLIPDELFPHVGTTHAPTIIEGRIEADFVEDPFLVLSGLRFVQTGWASVRACLLGRDAVLVCQKGKKLSQGLAAWLRSDGCQAQYLEGGSKAAGKLPRRLASALRPCRHSGRARRYGSWPAGPRWKALPHPS